MNIQIFSRGDVSPEIEQAFGAAMLCVEKKRGHVGKIPLTPDRSARAPDAKDRVIEVIRKFGPVSITEVSIQAHCRKPTVKCIVSTMKARGEVKVISGGRHCRYVLA